MMISYAQNFEDVMLNRVFRDRTDGFYVDVGAADPVNLSVTKWFYDHGWTGINIEPLTEFFEKLEAQRPRDINLNCGAGSISGEALLHELSTKEWSSFSENGGAGNRGPSVATRSVPISTLDSILATHAGERPIDFLKIDVEGWEQEVLRGIDLHRHRPKIILIEAVDRDTHAVNSGWEDLLLGSDYRLVYFDGLNKFYAIAEDREIEKHFAVPPNVFDDFQLNIHVEAQKQVVELTRMVERADEYRKAHLEQINQLTDWLKECTAERTAQFEESQRLVNLLEKSETKRQAVLDRYRRVARVGPLLIGLTSSK